jgi:hypothetical protein
MTADVHENFAKETFARCWDLLGRSLNDAEKRDLVGYALTSRYHWQQVGGGQQLAIADWMASRAYAAVGQPALAVEYAMASLKHGNEDFPSWLKASLNEGVARAYASAGDHQLRDKYVARALTELEKESAPEDAGLIRNQIEELLDD